MQFFGLGSPKPINLANYASSFKGTLLKNTDFPYFSDYLRVLAQAHKNKSAADVSTALHSYLCLRPPQTLFGLKKELLSTVAPGHVIRSFETSTNPLRYSPIALEEFYKSQGIDSPIPVGFTIRNLALVSRFLDLIPTRLKHCAPYDHLHLIAESLVNFRNASSQDQEDAARNCLRHLGSLFYISANQLSPLMHESDADMICQLADVAVKTKGAVYTLFQIQEDLKRQLGMCASAPLNLTEDQNTKNEAARQAIREIFAYKLFPTLSISGRFRTYAGEEV